MIEFHKKLSERTVYLRYFQPLKLTQRTAHERLTRICFIDYDREMALVVERKKSDGTPDIIAVGRLSKIHGRPEAELAALVQDELQRQGNGRGTLSPPHPGGARSAPGQGSLQHARREQGDAAPVQEAGLPAERAGPGGQPVAGGVDAVAAESNRCFAVCLPRAASDETSSPRARSVICHVYALFAALLMAQSAPQSPAHAISIRVTTLRNACAPHARGTGALRRWKPRAGAHRGA